MAIIKRITILSLCLAFGACGKTLVGMDAENTPESNFQVLWDEFDQLYPSFDVKNVDWNALYETYRPRVTAQTSEGELFNVMTFLLSHLDDGHVNLTASFAVYYSDQARRAQYQKLALFPVVKEKYLSNRQTVVGKGNIVYGSVSEAVGYIRIVSFADPNSFGDIDLAINELKDMTGIIVDVRNNSGGSNSHLIAGRFADREYLYAYTQRRNGHKHTDMAPKEAWFVLPRGSVQFTKKVALLTNRFSASESEWFRLAMDEFPHVTTLGEPTIGDMAHNLFRALPNGWAYRISVAKVSASDGTIYEGRGIPPDIQVAHTEEDVIAGRDPVIEAAMALLQN